MQTHAVALVELPGFLTGGSKMPLLGLLRRWPLHTTTDEHHWLPSASWCKGTRFQVFTTLESYATVTPPGNRSVLHWYTRQVRYRAQVLVLYWVRYFSRNHIAGPPNPVGAARPADYAAHTLRYRPIEYRLSIGGSGSLTTLGEPAIEAHYSSRGSSEPKARASGGLRPYPG